jgi:hypothetical protein
MIVAMHRTVLAVALLASASLASAQDPMPPLNVAPTEPPQRSVPTLPTPHETFGAIGRLIDQSISNVGAGVRGAGETLGATTDAAGDLAKGVGDAAGTVARLPNTNIVSGYQLCSAAPNGAPDCGGASEALCKTKGYQRGNSLDITSAFKCPAQMWREGRAPNPQECRDESFVSRAICQ